MPGSSHSYGIKRLVEERQSYALQIGDVLEVKFYYSPKLNETAIIRFMPAGRSMAPGMIALKGNTTVLHTIGNAGGFKETAHRGNIIIISRGK